MMGDCDEPTAHLLDVEPEMFLGVSRGEMSTIMLVSLLAGALIAAAPSVLLALWLESWAMLVLDLPLGILLALLIGWRLANAIGKAKRGKPWSSVLGIDGGWYRTELTEDGQKDHEAEVQKLTDKHVKEIEEQVATKEAEVMKV